MEVGAGRRLTGETDMTKTTDLGQGWFANLHDDGALTIRNPDKGQRINLTKAEAARLREILAATLPA
jgi:hypothetical protein